MIQCRSVSGRRAQRLQAEEPYSITLKYFMDLKFSAVHYRSTAVAIAHLALGLFASVASVPIGNPSFELPSTTFVNPQIDRWNKTPQPDWFQPQNGITWDQLSGVFANTAPGSPGHIINMDGNQAAYLISLPQAGITQILPGKFEAGVQYTASFGVIAGGNITEGTSLLVALFYLDDAGAPVTVASKVVIYSPAAFPNSTQFQTQQAASPLLKSGDAAVGRNIGIQIVGTAGDGFGYWDIDDVRISETVYLPVPNASLESPSTAFVDTRIDGWTKTSKPADYDESSGQNWDQLSGVFKNPDPGKEGYIDNIDGNQAAFLFAVPGTGIYLEGTEAGGPFPARYGVGDTITLTVGVIGGGGNMLDGAGLRIELFALGDGGTRIPVRSTTALQSKELFPSLTNFVDIQVSVPPVTSSDPWAGRLLGLGIFSAVTEESGLKGGYWDLDNVRLAVTRPDVLPLAGVSRGENLEITWPGSLGTWYRLQTSPDLRTWSDSGAPLEGLGQPLVATLPIGAVPGTLVRVVSVPAP